MSHFFEATPKKSPLILEKTQGNYDSLFPSYFYDPFYANFVL